jgi:hypothetical protein
MLDRTLLAYLESIMRIDDFKPVLTFVLLAVSTIMMLWFIELFCGRISSNCGQIFYCDETLNYLSNKNHTYLLYD